MYLVSFSREFCWPCREGSHLWLRPQSYQVVSLFSVYCLCFLSFFYPSFYVFVLLFVVLCLPLFLCIVLIALSLSFFFSRGSLFLSRCVSLSVSVSTVYLIVPVILPLCQPAEGHQEHRWQDPLPLLHMRAGPQDFYGLTRVNKPGPCLIIGCLLASIGLNCKAPVAVLYCSISKLKKQDRANNRISRHIRVPGQYVLSSHFLFQLLLLTGSLLKDAGETPLSVQR